MQYTTDGRLVGNKAARTRSTLIETAKDLMNRYPLHNLTVVDITREAAVSPGTFYQYFRHLDLLVEEMAESIGSIEAEYELWEQQVLFARKMILASRAITKNN